MKCDKPANKNNIRNQLKMSFLRSSSLIPSCFHFTAIIRIFSFALLHSCSTLLIFFLPLISYTSTLSCAEILFNSICSTIPNILSFNGFYLLQCISHISIIKGNFSLKDISIEIALHIKSV